VRVGFGTKESMAQFLRSLLPLLVAFGRMLVSKLFVEYGKVVYPMLATIPGAGVMFLELQDHFDDLPATVFDAGTFALGCVALGGWLIEKGVRKYFPKQEG
jgi:hypothetical protein